MIQNHLKKQIDEKRRIETAQKYKERLEDTEKLWIAGKVMEKERQEKINKEKFSKSMYKQIWKEQIKMDKHRKERLNNIDKI